MTSTPTPPPAPTGQESADRIVWIDCEMTGLDLGADALVEVAAVVTDSELRVLGERCRRHHRAAGRVARCR